MHYQLLSSAEELLAEVRRQRQTVAVKAARRLFSVGLFVFLVFLVPRWLAGVPSMAMSLEFLAFAAGTAGLYLVGDARPARGAMIIVVSYGIACFFALLEFGPNMGVGFLALGWMLTMAGLVEKNWLGVFLVTGVTAGVGVANQLGWIGGWNIQLTALDWTRTTFTVGIMSVGAAVVIKRMNDEVVEAWHREALALSERTAAERSAMEAQRLESVGKLAGGVAHDFNNSLAVLVAGISALQKSVDEDQRKLLLDNMDQAAQGAVATTRQLLSLSRQGLEPGLPGNPKMALQGLVPNLQRLFPETIQVHTHLQDTGYVALSEGNLEQVVLNLCLNARDAMPKGGALEISCATRNEHVVIAIHDTGHGMDAATLAQARSAFFTTKKTGTGLGLAMVQDAVHSVGGNLEIDSEEDAGTTIRLVLPIVDAPEIDPVEKAPTPVDASVAGSRILLAEDSTMVRILYTEVLSQAGFDVHAVESVGETLSAMAAEDYDILVTDAVLPDGDPTPAINQFRENGWKPVLVCSGYIDSEELVRDLGQSDYQFLQKPFPNELLVDTVERLLSDTVPD